MQRRVFTEVFDSRWRVLLKGLPFDVTTEEILDVFSNRSVIQGIFLESRRNRPTGCAIVNFNSELEAVRALKELGEVYIRKRKVVASLDFTDLSQRIQQVHKPIMMDKFRLPARFF